MLCPYPRSARAISSERALRQRLHHYRKLYAVRTPIISNVNHTYNHQPFCKAQQPNETEFSEHRMGFRLRKSNKTITRTSEQSPAHVRTMPVSYESKKDSYTQCLGECFSSRRDRTAARRTRRKNVISYAVVPRGESHIRLWTGR